MESVCMCAMMAVWWKLKVEWRTNRDSKISEKRRVLTRCQLAKVEETPTESRLRLSVTYGSLQRGLIQENVRTLGFADGGFERFFQ